MSQDSWVALESNPDCFNEILEGLSVKSVVVKDVFAFEKDAYHGTRPYALFLCFSNYEEAKKILDEQNQAVAALGVETPKDIFVVKQTFENSSGLVALFNALSNLEGRIDLGEGAFSDWLRSGKAVGEDARGDLIKIDQKIKLVHDTAAKKGATKQEDNLNNHFMTFLYKGGVIYEIDARGLLPKAVGKTSEEDFLVDCGAVIKEFVAKVKSEGSYSALALLPAN